MWTDPSTPCSMRTPRPVRVACSGVCSAESMIGIENYVSEQLLLFLRSIGLGLCLGLLYDLLGALRGLGFSFWPEMGSCGFLLRWESLEERFYSGACWAGFCAPYGSSGWS